MHMNIIMSRRKRRLMNIIMSRDFFTRKEKEEMWIALSDQTCDVGMGGMDSVRYGRYGYVPPKQLRDVLPTSRRYLVINTPTTQHGIPLIVNSPGS